MAELDSEGKHGITLSTGRLESLADGIFAFAMTLLIMSLIFPDTVPESANMEVQDLLFGQADKFINYAMSFILLAVFWLAHHQQFHYIKRTDSRLLWINIFLLMFVTLVPFSTDIVGDFSGQTNAEVLFAVNLLMLGLLFWANWVYATRNHRLVDPELRREIIARGTRRNLVTPAVSLIVLVLSFFIPQWSPWLYLSIPVMLSIGPFRR